MQESKGEKKMSRKYMGIDVSDNQGKIDWKQVVEDGCQFAILRSVRHSGKADNQFEANQGLLRRPRKRHNRSLIS